MALSPGDIAIIEEDVKSRGWGAKRIVKEPGARKWPIPTVALYVRKIKENKPTKRAAGSGRPRSVRPGELVAKVADFIGKNPSSRKSPLRAISKSLIVPVVRFNE